MSPREFEITQAINAVCFGLVRKGYSLDEIKIGLHNTMNTVGSDNDSATILRQQKK